jgi:hypothetical protein
MYSATHLKPEQTRSNPLERKKSMRYYNKMKLQQQGAQFVQNKQVVHWHELLLFSEQTKYANRLKRDLMSYRLGFSLGGMALGIGLIIPGVVMMSLPDGTNANGRELVTFLPGVVMLALGTALLLTPVAFATYHFHINPPIDKLQASARQYNSALRKQLGLQTIF